MKKLLKKIWFWLTPWNKPWMDFSDWFDEEDEKEINKQLHIDKF